MSTSCRKIIACAILTTAATATIFADTRLVVAAPDGTISGVSLSEIKQINFNSGNQMSIVTNSDTKLFDLAKIGKITFDFETSANKRIEASIDDLSIVLVGGIMTVSSAAGKPVAVDIYNLQGILVDSGRGIARVNIDFNTLTNGIYIVKANDKIIKFNSK